MKLSNFLTGIFLLISPVAFAQLSPQDTLIRYYQKYPQQAIRQAEEMHREAIRTHNDPLLIKSLILKTTLTLETDPDAYPAMLEELETYIDQAKDTVVKSILHSYAGQLYTQFYDGQRYSIDQRTPLEGYVPKNMEEWTSNLFKEKIFNHFRASISPQAILQATPVSAYREIFVFHVNPDTLRPTLYDFLCHRAINLLPGEYNDDFMAGLKNSSDLLGSAEIFIKSPIPLIPLDATSNILNIWQKLLAFRLESDQAVPLIVADLERLLYVQAIYHRPGQDTLLLATLQAMREKYAALPVSVEIMAQEATLLAGSRNTLRPLLRSDSEDLTGKQEALALCKAGIGRFPAYSRINLLHKIISELKAPELNTQFPQMIYPGEEIKLQVSSRNIKTFTVALYRIDTAAIAYFAPRNKEESKMPQTRIYEQTYALHSSLINQDTAFYVPAPQPGLYQITITTPGAKQNVSDDLIVTSLFGVVQNIRHQNFFRVCDWQSGKPVKNATIYIYTRQHSSYRLIDSAFTNAQGLATLPSKGDIYQVVNKENPQGCPIYSYTSEPNTEPNRRVNLFTDRKIYRAGQTVYFKGIAWEASPDSLFTQKGIKLTVSFFGSNRKQIKAQQVVTNEFGSFSGSFVIPAQVLNGNFLISTDRSYTAITVADYKRPEFEIIFTASERAYYTGDTIQVKGKINSFSGVNLTNNTLKYKITRNNPWDWQRGTENANQGITTTNTNGEFEFSFIAEEPSQTSLFRRPYSYQVTVTTTDPKGETQEAYTQIPVYTGQATPVLQVPEQVNKEIATAFSISLADLAPDATHKKVQYSISRLVAPTEIQNSNPFQDTLIEKTILQGELTMGARDSITPSLGNQPSGAYLLTVTCGINKADKIFYLYSPSDKRPPIPTYKWIVREKTDCRAGDTAKILFGTSAHNAYVIYEIFTDRKLIRRNFVTLSNEIISIDVPFLADYGNQIWLSISYVKDKIYTQESIPIRRIRENSRLTLQTKVFRDKLYPGQKEQWELRVVDEKGQPVKAEVLAMMYDASLDQLAPNPIYFRPDYTYLSFPYNREYSRYSSLGYLGLSSWQFRQKNYPVPPSRFDQLNLYHPTYRSMSKANGMELADATSDFGSYESSETMAEAVVTGYGTTAKKNSLSAAPPSVNLSGGAPEVQFRQDFQETAFFYPQLLTDSAGTAVIKFTIPESTTKWKFTALATTQNLATGKLVEYITTSKPLMVRPNLPRFLRSGDKTELKVTVSNLSDSLQTGEATFEFFLPGNNQVVKTRTVAFRIAGGQSQTLSYNFDVPQQQDVIGCRISAISGNFSDGEQQLLPVLPDEMLVTSTLPFYTAAKGEHTYTLENTSASRKDYRLTLEFTANPIWYAVMALPPLSEPANNNVTDVAAAYYVNTIAAAIARSNPRIVEVIRNWKASQDDPNTLLSKLEQNSELKSVLLSATPWVLQAQNETERMQMLQSLFDKSRLEYLQEQALDKLSALQTPGGGWSWFKGMYPSRFMTMNVLGMMARANTTGQKEYGEREKNMQIKALRHLDEEIKKDFKDKPKDIHSGQVIYLYIRSMYRDIPLGDALGAHKYFMALAQKQWSGFSLYEKGITAITFHHYGFRQESQDILRSLREYAKTTPDMGMFWPNNRNLFPGNPAVQVQATIMEAFYLIEGNTTDINLMQQWLLRQKQTQMWESVPATVDAIHALLLTGDNLPDAQDQTRIDLGSHQFVEPSDSNPLGYVKASYSGAEIKPDMLTVKLKKTTDTPGWGGLYLQYFEKLNSIQKQKEALGVDKKLFIEQVTAGGKKELQSIRQRPLKIGDKVIVRLTLTLTRDMEFLHLKDLRAACFEPVEQISGNQWKFGTVYYQEVKDAATNFFFNALPRGTYVIEYPVWVNQAGEYQDGVATFQSIYAPEYNSYSETERIEVKNQKVAE